MNIREVITVVNQMEADGIIERYRIGVLVWRDSLLLGRISGCTFSTVDL